MPTCPTCGSTRVVKNGHIHNGKQNHKCKDCHRQFVLNPTNKVIDERTWQIIDARLLERRSLVGIARATGVSEAWLQQYVNRKCEEVEQSVAVRGKKKGRS